MSFQGHGKNVTNFLPNPPKRFSRLIKNWQEAQKCSVRPMIEQKYEKARIIHLTCL